MKSYLHTVLIGQHQDKLFKEQPNLDYGLLQTLKLQN